MHVPHSSNRVNQGESNIQASSWVSPLFPALRGAVVAYMLSLSGIGHAEETPETQELRAEVTAREEEIKGYQLLVEEAKKISKEIEKSEKYDPELALELTVLNIEIQRLEHNLKSTEENAVRVNQAITETEKKAVEAENIERALYQEEAKEYANNPALWNQFVQEATLIFQAYERLPKIEHPTMRQQEYLDAIQRGLRMYKTPENAQDFEKIGNCRFGLHLMGTAINGLMQEIQNDNETMENAGVIMTIDIPDGGRIKFATTDGRKSPEFTINSQEFDVYPLGAATLTIEEDGKWKVTFDPDFTGKFFILRKGEKIWEEISIRPAIDASPESESPKGERAAPLQETARPSEVESINESARKDARVERKVISERGTMSRTQWEISQLPPESQVELPKQYALIIEQYKNSIDADRATKGGSAEWQASEDEFQQRFADLVKDMIMENVDPGTSTDFEWRQENFGKVRMHPFFKALRDTLTCYESERESIPNSPLFQVPIVETESIDIYRAAAEIDSFVRTMKRNNHDKVPEAYVSIHADYNTILIEALAEENPDEKFVKIILAYWLQAARLHAEHKQEEQKEPKGSLFSVPTFLTQAKSAISYSPTMSEHELRKQILTDAQEKPFLIRRDVKTLKGLFEFKKEMRNILGDDGEFSWGDFPQSAGDVIGDHGKCLQEINIEGESSLHAVEVLTGCTIQTQAAGCINAAMIDWFLAAYNSPTPYKGVPHGIYFDIRKE